MNNLNQIAKLVSKKEIIAIILFFSVYLFIGINIYDDYGVHTDEFNNQGSGERWIKYINESWDAGYLLKHKTNTSRNYRGFKLDIR
jgi:hypothetical protein